MTGRSSETGQSRAWITRGSPRAVGQALLKAGAFDLAAVALRQALSDTPDDSDLLLDLSALAERAGDQAEARRLAERAVAIRPFNPPTPAEDGPVIWKLRCIDSGAWKLKRTRGAWGRRFRGGHFSTRHLLRGSGLSPQIASLCGGRTQVLDRSPAPDLIINAIACADRGAEVLKALAAWTSGRPELQVINPPERVALTTRDENARRLGRLDGVRFPRTLRLPAGTRGPRAWELIREVGLSPPLILRESGRQTGRATELCESAEDLSDALARAAPDRDHYVVEYLDTRDGEGRFRKMRAFAIDGRVYPVSCLTSDHWQIHSRDRYRLMDKDEATQAREQAYLADPPSVVGDAVWSALGRVFETLGLDFAGADFTVDRDGRLVVFEANPAMRHNFDHAGAFPYTRPHLERVSEAFTAMVRSRARAAPSEATS